MTLRDALAEALHRHDWGRPPAADQACRHVGQADAALADPAFREALVEAVQSGLSAPVYVAGYSSPVFVGTVASWIPAITGPENVARTIVERMLGEVTG